MLFSVKQPNRSRIFDYILKNPKTSRQQLAASLQLSLPTVGQYIDELKNADLIIEDGLIEADHVGRKAAALSINSSSRIALGMDITRAHISLVAVNLSGEMIESHNEAFSFTDSPKSYRYLGETISQFISAHGWKPENIPGIGISLPAIISDQNTEIKQAVLNSVQPSFYKNMLPFCPVPLQIYNDANAGGFSEIYSRQNVSRIVYLSLSHSIGGAIIEDNQIVMGNNSRAGEFGHMTLIPNGSRCYCGKLGCANCYCSPDVLAAHTENDLDLFFERYESGDPECTEAFENYLDYLAILIHNIRICFDCSIVLGGGLGIYIERYLPLIRGMAGEKDHFETRAADYVLSNRYGGNASAVGAALFFINDFIRSI